MVMKIKVNDTTVWDTADVITEVSVADRSGEGGRVLVEADEDIINVYAWEDQNNLADRTSAPVANAGPDQSLANNVVCTLTAAASTGSAPLTYAWTKVSGTGGTLSSATNVAPTYTTHASTDDTTIWRCVVTDSEGRSSDDTVSIVVA